MPCARGLNSKFKRAHSNPGSWTCMAVRGRHLTLRKARRIDDTKIMSKSDGNQC